MPSDRLAPTARGALLDGPFRYRLWRRWDDDGPTASFIMLNPSTADATQDDPTIRRCIGFAKAWGCGAVEIGNLFALRSTSPRAIYENLRTVGPANDGHLVELAQRSSLVVCAWGVHGQHRGRGAEVLEMLRRHAALYHLGLTKDGHPRHPLYLKGDLRPMYWAGTEGAANG